MIDMGLDWDSLRTKMGFLYVNINKKIFKSLKKNFTVTPNRAQKFERQKNVRTKFYYNNKIKKNWAPCGVTVKYFFETFKNLFIYVLGKKNFFQYFP